MSRKKIIPTLLKSFVPVATYGTGVVLKLWPQVDLIYVVLMGGGIFLISTLAEYLLNVKPSEHWENVAPFFAEQLTYEFFDFVGRNAKIIPRMNVMRRRRRARNLWIRPYYEFWWTKGMNDQPDLGISFPEGRGVVSECFKRKVPLLSSPQELDEKYKLPTCEQSFAGDLTVLLSVPIYDHSVPGDILGVLNLDSKTPGAFNVFMRDQRLLLEVTREMKKIAALFSRMIV